MAELLERYRRGPELVAAVLTGAAGAELDWTPAPGKWSIRQILAHLADSEIVGAGRFRRTIAEDSPTLMGYDQEAWARNLGYEQRRVSESLKSFRRLRAENHELLKSLPESAFGRAATHSERGPLTLRQLLESDAAHVETHARQLQAIRRAYRKPGTDGTFPV